MLNVVLLFQSHRFFKALSTTLYHTVAEVGWAAVAGTVILRELILYSQELNCCVIDSNSLRFCASNRLVLISF